ncbi:MAG: hypothetical protein MJZ34_07195 [Paludibacteraceae bacterium]|nr:hypothetical protein [Paludibacteraceae bacterium]
MKTFKDLKHDIWNIMMDYGFNILTDIKYTNNNYGFKIGKGFNNIFELKLQDWYIKDEEYIQIKNAVSIALDKYIRYDYWMFFRKVKVYKQGVFQCQNIKTLNDLGENYHYDYTTNEIVYEKSIVLNEETNEE